ncbi:MAG TPA: fibronectin type III domain-containing protein, partial [Longimicrobium sp.]|nr:fibronectin type III domain-containing protein [Longimicrobium sp.]
MSAVPGVDAVVATSNAVTATVVVPSPAPNVTGYQGWLYEGDSVVAGPVVATTSEGVTSVAFSYAVAADKRYSIRVGATGAGSATGPQGAAAAVISAAPAVEATSYDGGTVTASWSPVLDPSVTAYVAALAEVGGATVGSPVTVEGTTVSIPAAGLDPAKTYQVTVQALSGSATGPAGTAGNVVVETVAVAASSYNGTLVALSWNNAQTEGATYVAQVLSGGTVVAEQVVAQTSAAIPVALAAEKSYAASVQVVAGSARGQSGTTAPVLAAVPGVTTVTADATSVTVVVEVPQTAPNVTGYRGWLYEGDRVLVGPVPATTSGGVTSVALAYAVVPQARYTVRVQAVGGSAAIAGPVSASAPVISAAPPIVATGYDGSTVTVAWEASADPNVSGYLATLSTAEGTVVGSPVATAGTRAVIPAASLSLDADYVVTVQATADAATGPASAPANPLAESVGYFFPDQSSTQYPYLFRGDLRAPGASNITLYLPALFSGELAAPIVQDPFTLSATAAGSTFPLVLTVPQDAGIDVWNVDQNGIRPALQSAYVAFLTKVEEDAAGLLPGALDVLRQAIAQGLPLNFAETLYYTYGLDPSAGVVDLMPGTRLRIDYEEYQSVPPGTGTPQPLLSGYTGAGTSVYDVGSLPPSSGAVPLGMNAFFSALPVPSVAGN